MSFVDFEPQGNTTFPISQHSTEYTTGLTLTVNRILPGSTNVPGELVSQEQVPDVHITSNSLSINDNLTAYYYGKITGVHLQTPLKFNVQYDGIVSLWINYLKMEPDSNGDFTFTFLSSSPVNLQIFYISVSVPRLILVTENITFSTEEGDFFPIQGIFNQFGTDLTIYGDICLPKSITIGDSLQISSDTLGNTLLNSKGDLIFSQGSITIGNTTLLEKCNQNNECSLNIQNVKFDFALIKDLIISNNFLQENIDIGMNTTFFDPTVHYEKTGKLRIVTENLAAITIYEKNIETPSFQIEKNGTLNYNCYVDSANTLHTDKTPYYFQLTQSNENFTVLGNGTSLFEINENETSILTSKVKLNNITVNSLTLGNFTLLEKNNTLYISGISIDKDGNLNTKGMETNNLKVSVISAETIQVDDLKIEKDINCNGSGVFRTLNSSGDVVSNKSLKSQIVEINGNNPQLLFNSKSFSAPQIGGSTPGTKIILSESQFPIHYDTAIGVDNNSMWFTVDGVSLGYYDWYSGNDKILSLSGDGNMESKFFTINNSGLSLSGQNIYFLGGKEVSPNSYKINVTDHQFTIGNDTSNLKIDSNGTLIINSSYTNFKGVVNFDEVLCVETLNVLGLTLDQYGITSSNDFTVETLNSINFSSKSLNLQNENLLIKTNLFKVNDTLQIDGSLLTFTGTQIVTNLTITDSLTVATAKIKSIETDSLKILSETLILGETVLSPGNISGDSLNINDCILISGNDVLLNKPVTFNSSMLVTEPIYYKFSDNGPHKFEKIIKNDTYNSQFFYCSSARSGQEISIVSFSNGIKLYFNASVSSVTTVTGGVRGLIPHHYHTKTDVSSEIPNIFCYENFLEYRFYIKLNKKSSSFISVFSENEIDLVNETPIGKLIYSTEDSHPTILANFGSLLTTTINNQNGEIKSGTICLQDNPLDHCMIISNTSLKMTNDTILDWSGESISCLGLLPISPDKSLGKKEIPWNQINANKGEFKEIDVSNLISKQVSAENLNVGSADLNTLNVNGNTFLNVDASIKGSLIVEGLSTLLQGLIVEDSVNFLKNLSVTNDILCRHLTCESLNSIKGFSINSDSLTLNSDRGTLITSFSDNSFNLSCPDTPIINICPNGLLQASFSNKNVTFYNGINIQGIANFLQKVNANEIELNNLNVKTINFPEWIVRIDDGQNLNFVGVGTLLTERFSGKYATINEIVSTKLSAVSLVTNEIKCSKLICQDSLLFTSTNGTIGKYIFDGHVSCKSFQSLSLSSDNIKVPLIFTSSISIENSPDYNVNFSVSPANFSFNLENNGGDLNFTSAGGKGLSILNSTGNTVFNGNLFVQSALDVFTTGSLEKSSASIYTKGGISAEGTIVCGKSLIIGGRVELRMSSQSVSTDPGFSLTLPSDLPQAKSLFVCDPEGNFSFQDLHETTFGQSILQRIESVENRLIALSVTDDEADTEKDVNENENDSSGPVMASAELMFTQQQQDSKIIKIGASVYKNYIVEIVWEPLKNSPVVTGNVVSYIDTQDIFTCSFFQMTNIGCKANIYCLTSDSWSDITLSLHYTIMKKLD